MVLLLMARIAMNSKMRAMRTRLTMPTTSMLVSKVNLGSKWGITIWLIEDVMGVSFDESFNSGKLFSNIVALSWDEKLKWTVILSCFKEYRLCSCFWSTHFIDHAPELMLHGKLQERLYAPGRRTL